MTKTNAFDAGNASVPGLPGRPGEILPAQPLRHARPCQLLRRGSDMFTYMCMFSVHLWNR